MLDLDGYLRRIDVDDAPALPTVHRAHAVAIPFENLDPWAGRPVALTLEALERKMVRERQGGYCFEQNLLLDAALRGFGFATDLLLARARTGGWVGPVRPRTHLALRVWSDGEPWLADVGFGFGGLLEPLPLRPGGPYVQSGWCFQIVADGEDLVLQAWRNDTWVDQYELPLRAVPLIDIETANWVTSTHPASPFVRGPVVTATARDGHQTLVRGDRERDFIVVEESPERRVETQLAADELPAVLRDRFGLDPRRLPDLAALAPVAR